MATRTLRPFHQEDVKAKIQASQLVNRLQDHIDGKTEMSPTQLDAAKFLLNKRLSNAATEMNVGGQADNPISISAAPILTPEQWIEAFGNKD